MRIIEAADALVGADFQPRGPQAIGIENGRISFIRPLERIPPGRRLLALPALADAHNHARPLSPTSFGFGFKPLETWLPSLACMPSVDAYTAAAAAFGRTVRGGCVTAVAHLTRAMGMQPYAEEAGDIARAARDVGLSIGFAIGMRDRNPIVYGNHEDILRALPDALRRDIQQTWLAPAASPAEQVRQVCDIAEHLRDEHHVDVQFGPNGVQWCSDGLLAAIADTSAQTGRRVHMHLLETQYQRAWADKAYPQGIVRHLADIGLLSPRLTLAHCVWARPQELEIMATHGCHIAVNPSSNLHLSSGIAAVSTMKSTGVSYALGLDGCALDEDDDALRELRLLRHLNAGWGYDEGITLVNALTAACSIGRRSTGDLGAGLLEVGADADLLLLDLDRLDRDRLQPVDPRHLLFARASQRDIVEVIKGGKTLCSQGRLTGLDLPAVEEDLRRQYRAALPSRTSASRLFDALEPLIRKHYCGCC